MDVMTDPVYLDYNATTPLTPGVLEVMTRFLAAEFGNPSSSHHFGSSPRAAIATARAQVAALLGTQAEQIVFTGSGSEASTLAIWGVTAGRTGQVITQATEHPAVLETCKALVAQRIRLTVLPVDEHGLVDPADLAEALADDTLLVSVMHANNETGTIQPIAELAALAGTGAAAAHAAETVAAQQVRLRALRDELHQLLAGSLSDRLVLNGHPHDRLPNTLNVSIAGTVGAQLLAATSGVAASTGSACHDGSTSSPVLAAMGHDAARAAAAIRLSLGRATTRAEIQFVAHALAASAN